MTGSGPAAAPRRSRRLAVAAGVIVVALIGAGAVFAVTSSGGGDTSAAAGPAATASGAPSSGDGGPAPAAGAPEAGAPEAGAPEVAAPADPGGGAAPSTTDGGTGPQATTPDATAAAPTDGSPAAPPPATGEDDVRAELQGLPAKFGAAADKAFLDRTGDPSDYFGPVAAAALYKDFLSRVDKAQAEGDVFEEHTTTIHSSDVTDLNLASGTATITSCETLAAASLQGADGASQSVNDPRGQMTYTAQRGSDGAWRLVARQAGGNNSC